MRPLHRSRKGDLAISTNAIVILIIAVIMLGLIIYFVTSTFTGISERFKSQLSKIDPPSTPNAGEPITQSGSKIIHPGDTWVVKIAVFNPTVQSVPDVQPTITCGSNTVFDTANEQSNKKTIPSRDSAVFDYIVPVSKSVASGQKLCQLKTVGDSIPGIETDIVIEVAK